jgi:hypothetical protein
MRALRPQVAHWSSFFPGMRYIEGSCIRWIGRDFVWYGRGTSYRRMRLTPLTLPLVIFYG